MTPRQKVDAAVAYLKARGVRATNAAPPLWACLWRLGLPVPPPHFLNFPSIALVTGFPFSLLMTAGISVALFVSGEAAFTFPLRLGAGSGVLFGLGMATFYRLSARRLGVPPWRDFPSDAAADDTW